MQMLARQAQRGGVARAQRFWRLLHFIDVMTQFGRGIVQRGAQARRQPGQHGKVARYRGGGRGDGQVACRKGHRRQWILHGRIGAGGLARDREIQ
ncbi:hypothetical protein ACU4HD_01990 [Cupriavidus basilensis]